MIKAVNSVETLKFLLLSIKTLDVKVVNRIKVFLNSAIQNADGIRESLYSDHMKLMIFSMEGSGVPVMNDEQWVPNLRPVKS